MTYIASNLSEEEKVQNDGPLRQETKTGGPVSPKTAFMAGFAGGILIVCTLGFFILLTIVLRGGSLAGIFKPTSLAAATVSAPAPKPTVTAPSPSNSGNVQNVRPVSKQDHIRGDAEAPVKIIEYSDIECPFCKRFHPTMKQVVSEYQGKVAWVYRHFPLSFHQNAEKEAEATECANELGGNDAFWKYVDTLFERTTSNGTGFALDQLAPLAKEIGLDETKFKSCLDSGKYASRVQQDERDGASAGVTGTPGNIVIGKDGKAQLVEGAVPFEQLKAVVDSFLN